MEAKLYWFIYLYTVGIRSVGDYFEVAHERHQYLSSKSPADCVTIVLYLKSYHLIGLHNIFEVGFFDFG